LVLDIFGTLVRAKRPPACPTGGWDLVQNENRTSCYHFATQFGSTARHKTRRGGRSRQKIQRVQYSPLPVITGWNERKRITNALLYRLSYCDRAQCEVRTDRRLARRRPWRQADFQRRSNKPQAGAPATTATHLSVRLATGHAITTCARKIYASDAIFRSDLKPNRGALLRTASAR
jgi:hypothetical protein